MNKKMGKGVGERLTLDMRGTVADISFNRNRFFYGVSKWAIFSRVRNVVEVRVKSNVRNRIWSCFVGKVGTKGVSREFSGSGSDDSDMGSVWDKVKMKAWGKAGTLVMGSVEEATMRKVLVGVGDPVWGTIRSQVSIHIQDSIRCGYFSWLVK